MAQVPKRTPKATKKAIRKVGGVANPKHTEVYAKQMTFTLAGSNPAELQSVAKAAHDAITNHECVKGGKKKRRVTATHQSSEPLKIFDGTIRPDGV